MSTHNEATLQQPAATMPTPGTSQQPAPRDRTPTPIPATSQQPATRDRAPTPTPEAPGQSVEELFDSVIQGIVTGKPQVWEDLTKVEVPESELLEIEQVMGKRRGRKEKGNKSKKASWEYWVRWSGYPDVKSSWEPASSIPKKLIDDFEKSKFRQSK